MLAPHTATRPEVPRHFTAEDEGIVLCIAPGPSLTYSDLRTAAQLQRDVSQLAVITINDAYRHFPTSQYRFASDGYWWTSRFDASDPAKYSGRCYCLEYGAPDRVTKLDYFGGDRNILSDDRATLVTGGHSGYAAINFAYLLGAATIVLLGYDMQPHPVTGVHHFQGDEAGQRHLRYHLWIPRYEPLARALKQRHVTLLNATRHTAIPSTVVPRCSLADVV